jgi:hypothetical protein
VLCHTDYTACITIQTAFLKYNYLLLCSSLPKRTLSPETTTHQGGATKSAPKELSKSANAVLGGKPTNTMDEALRDSSAKADGRGEATTSIITGGLFRNKYRMAGTHDPRKVHF